MTVDVSAAAASSATFLGVSENIFATPLGLADAVFSASDLGVEVLALRDAYVEEDPARGGVFTKLLDDYRAAPKQPARALAALVRGTPHATFQKVMGRVARQVWPMQGGLFATQTPQQLQPFLQVFSRDELIPLALRLKRHAVPLSMNFRHIGKEWVHGVVDLRDIAPIHHLSEPQAAELIEKKLEEARGVLRFDSYSEKGGEIYLPLLMTRGDKNSDNDQIRVLFEEGEKFLLLNGHRRLTALALLVALGKIPSSWLTQIPVWAHSVKDGSNIRQVIGRQHPLTWEEVFSEIFVRGTSPVEGLFKLAKHEKRKHEFVAGVSYSRKPVTAANGAVVGGAAIPFWQLLQS